jgi:hypothetical protein
MNGSRLEVVYWKPISHGVIIRGSCEVWFEIGHQSDVCAVKDKLIFNVYQAATKEAHASANADCCWDQQKVPENIGKWVPVTKKNAVVQPRLMFLCEGMTHDIDDGISV